MLALQRTIYVCSVCHRQSDDLHTHGWLLDEPKNAEKACQGEMVIRCPEHVTRYAIRLAKHGKQAVRE